MANLTCVANKEKKQQIQYGGPGHRKKRLIEGNAKCRHIKDFAAGVYLSDAQNPIAPYTLYTCILYTNSHRKGVRGGELKQREGVRDNSSQSWVENTSMTECISCL